MKDVKNVVIPDLVTTGRAEMNAAGRFALLIPVYNHAEGIVSVIERARPLALPIWVIDDGSTDGTTACLQRVAGITVLRHEKNLGKGAAILTGFSALQGTADWVVTLDADGQHNPQDVPGSDPRYSTGAPSHRRRQTGGDVRRRCPLDEPLRPEIFQFLGPRRRRSRPFRYPERDARLSPAGVAPFRREGTALSVRGGNPRPGSMAGDPYP